MTIRASQVIPVYPLTEDIQPGDIFLVQVPIDRQQKLYEDRGFLPLDNHVARLNPNGYTDFYANSFLAGISSPLLPRDWAHPVSISASANNSSYWTPAPRAAFPTYSFSIRRGAGLNLAVPVQGVPVGLSLLGSDAADGSISINKASTLGVDILSLHQQLTEWAHKNSSFLQSFGPTQKETNYLRIVTRVYVTGDIDVELRDASTKSAGLDVGVPKPVNLLFPELSGKSNITSVVAQNYTNGWNILTGLLQQATSATEKFAPGGSLRLMAASSRTIALKETFDPPLMLGYLGFDCAVLDHGRLGPPVATHAQLDRNARIHHARVQQFNADEIEQIDAYKAVASRYTNSPSARQDKIRQLAREVKLSVDGDGLAWVERLAELTDGADRAKTQHFNALKKLLEELK